MSKDKGNINIPRSAFKEWLEKLQQESWQLELLISGFALLGILEAKSLVESFASFRELQRGSDSLFSKSFYTFFMHLMTIGWRIFFFNLLIHIVTRGLWIGAIGLRYVSSDIDYDYFNYADIFTRFLKRRVGDFDDYIEKLERFASVLFAYTFLLFFIFLSLILYFSQIGLIVGIAGENHGLTGMLILVFLSFGLITFIDFITMGGIKKIKEKSLSRIYFVIYRIFGILTLSFLYRPLLYNFWDEKYTRRLFLASIPYIIFLSILPNIVTDSTPFFPIHQHGDIQDRAVAEPMLFSSEYYDDERELMKEKKGGFFYTRSVIRGLSLPSIELSGSHASFFLRSYPSDTKWLEKEKKIIPYKKEGLSYKGIKDVRQDSLYDKLQEERSAELATLGKTRRALRKQLRDNEITAVAIGIEEIEGKFQLDLPYWESQKDSIAATWEDKITTYNRNKIQKLNNSMLELARIHIDGVPYNDSCDCKFYIHQNWGERGLKCYFSMEHLSSGKHLLHLERGFYKTRTERLDTTHHYVPFYKID